MIKIDHNKIGIYHNGLYCTSVICQNFIQRFPQYDDDNEETSYVDNIAKADFEIIVEKKNPWFRYEEFFSSILTIESNEVINSYKFTNKVKFIKPHDFSYQWIFDLILSAFNEIPDDGINGYANGFLESNILNEKNMFVTSDEPVTKKLLGKIDETSWETESELSELSETYEKQIPVDIFTQSKSNENKSNHQEKIKKFVTEYLICEELEKVKQKITQLENKVNDPEWFPIASYKHSLKIVDKNYKASDAHSGDLMAIFCVEQGIEKIFMNNIGKLSNVTFGLDNFLSNINYSNQDYYAPISFDIVLPDGSLFRPKINTRGNGAFTMGLIARSSIPEFNVCKSQWEMFIEFCHAKSIKLLWYEKPFTGCEINITYR